MSADFASTGDLADKPITFDAIGPDLYAFTAEGDPNSGVIVGDDGATAVATEAHLTVRAGSTEDIEARPEIAAPVPVIEPGALEPGRQPSP